MMEGGNVWEFTFWVLYVFGKEEEWGGRRFGGEWD